MIVDLESFAGRRCRASGPFSNVQSKVRVAMRIIENWGCRRDRDSTIWVEFMRNEKLTINEVLRNFRSGSPSDMSTETAARKANNVTTGHNATRRVCVCGVTANTAAKKYPSKGGSICDIKVIMSMGNRIDGNKRLLTRTRQGKDVIESSSSTTFIILHGSGWSD